MVPPPPIKKKLLPHGFFFSMDYIIHAEHQVFSGLDFNLHFIFQSLRLQTQGSTKPISKENYANAVCCCYFYRLNCRSVHHQQSDRIDRYINYTDTGAHAASAAINHHNVLQEWEAVRIIEE